MSEYLPEDGEICGKTRQIESSTRDGALWRDDDDFHRTIQSKLTGLLETPQFLNFSRCGREEIYRRCGACKKGEWLKWRCNLKWCPRCQWRLAEARKSFLQEYARQIAQPKHLVLTSRNFPRLTKRKLQSHQLDIAAVRNRVCFSNVKGGSVSIEVTWSESGKVINGVAVAGGWHLHSHWLINSRWLDMEEVERSWCELIGQDISINRIYDCRNEDYLKEICKYVVEGSELASWPAEIIREFVTAIKGVRFFFTFGELQKMGGQIRAAIKANHEAHTSCDCGEHCSKFRIVNSDETTRDRNKLRKREFWRRAEAIDKKELTHTGK